MNGDSTCTNLPGCACSVCASEPDTEQAIRWYCEWFDREEDRRMFGTVAPKVTVQ